MVKSTDFQLSDEQLRKLTSFAQSRASRHAELEQFSDLTVSFTFGPPFGRIVTVSFAGSPEIDLDDLP